MHHTKYLDLEECILSTRIDHFKHIIAVKHNFQANHCSQSNHGSLSTL